MKSLSEQSFHVLMAALLAGSCLMDRYLPESFSGWNPLSVSVLSLAIGLVWIGRFTTWRLELASEQLRVMRDRLERVERQHSALEDELRRQGRLPF